MSRILRWTQADVGITPWHKPWVRGAVEREPAPEGRKSLAHGASRGLGVRHNESQPRRGERV
jgi:hypothetical protein